MARCTREDAERRKAQILKIAQSLEKTGLTLRYADFVERTGAGRETVAKTLKKHHLKHVVGR